MLTFSSINLKEESIYFSSQCCDGRNMRKMKFLSAFHKYVTFAEVNISKFAFQTVDLEKSKLHPYSLLSSKCLTYVIYFSSLVYAYGNTLFYILKTESSTT